MVSNRDRFVYQDNKKGDVVVFDRKLQRQTAGFFKVARDGGLYYAYTLSKKKPLILNPNNPDKSKNSAFKKLKSFIERKYK